MAASLGTLIKSRSILCSFIASADFLRASPRILVCHQQARGRRRSSRPAGWFVKRKVPQVDQHLTQENIEFLKKAFEDEYKNLSSPLKNEPWPRNEWTPTTRRTGVLGVKLGYMPQWTKEGKLCVTTLIQVIDNHVIRYTPPEKFIQSAGYKPWWGDKFGHVVVGALSCEPWKFTKAYNNLFLEAGVPPKRRLTRFLVTPDAAIQPGTPLNVMHFKVGDYVDVSSKTIDHGFQGVMKRWGFKGGPASHGSTKFHRRPGGIGGGGTKHGVWKGKKMPGHMGNDWKIGKGLKILRMNTKYNILYVKGMNVPGPTHAYVRIYDTMLNHRKSVEGNTHPMPTYYPEDDSEEIQEEYFDNEIFQFTDDSIKYEDEQ